jgi:hypothetical protein
MPAQMSSVRQLSSRLLQFLVHVSRSRAAAVSRLPFFGQQQWVGDQPIDRLGQSRGPGIGVIRNGIDDPGADRGREAADGEGAADAWLLALRLAPNRGQPRLPLWRQTGRPVVMMQLNETGRNHVVAPCVEVEEAGVAAVAKTFFVVPPWI